MPHAVEHEYNTAREHMKCCSAVGRPWSADLSVLDESTRAASSAACQRLRTAVRLLASGTRPRKLRLCTCGYSRVRLCALLHRGWCWACTW